MSCFLAISTTHLLTSMQFIPNIPSTVMLSALMNSWWYILLVQTVGPMHVNRVTSYIVAV